jgi:hypothetical protein
MAPPYKFVPCSSSSLLSYDFAGQGHLLPRPSAFWGGPSSLPIGVTVIGAIRDSQTPEAIGTGLPKHLPAGTFSPMGREGKASRRPMEGGQGAIVGHRHRG